MQKFKFNNPSSVVAISKSPLDKAEAGNPYTIYDCYCHLAAKQGQHAKGFKDVSNNRHVRFGGRTDCNSILPERL